MYSVQWYRVYTVQCTAVYRVYSTVHFLCTEKPILHYSFSVNYSVTSFVKIFYTLGGN